MSPCPRSSGLRNSSECQPSLRDSRSLPEARSIRYCSLPRSRCQALDLRAQGGCQLLAARAWILLFFASLTQSPEDPDPYTATGKAGACEHAVNPRIKDNRLLDTFECSQLPPSCLSTSNLPIVPSPSTTGKGRPSPRGDDSSKSGY